MTNCKYTFDGKKWYSYDEFRGYLLDNIDKLSIDKEKLTGKLRPLQQEPVEQYQKNTDFNNYREKQLGRNLDEEQQHLDAIDEALNDPEYSDEQKQQLQDAKDVILERIHNDRQSYDDFAIDMNKVAEIVNTEDLSKVSLDDLIEAYNAAANYEGYGDKALLDKAKLKIGYFLNETGKERLRKHDKFIESEANKKDLKWRNIWFRTLSHMTQQFPELQELSKIFDNAFLTMQQERNTEKRKLERLGLAVIRETNKKMGIAERALSLFHPGSAKYFEYLDNGKGQFITDTKGLSKAQIDFLNYMKNLTKERNIIYDEQENVIENPLLYIDKGFNETFKTEGLLPAMSLYMGGGQNTDVEVSYTNPKTGKKETNTYANAQKNVIDAANSRQISKPAALSKLLQLSYKAKKAGQLSNYSLNYNGQLTSKFDAPVDRSKGYSKDFYKAAHSYIDDITHVRNMNKIIPIVNSIDYLYERGFDSSFPNVRKFLEEWKNTQIYQKTKVTDPAVDTLLKFFRNFTSMITMSFNYPAAVMNSVMGLYNNWRAEGSKLWVIGNKRLFGKDGFNKYGVDLLKKYDVVDSDYDSNPKLFAGKLFDLMAYGAQRFGEYQIQGSMFLAQLTDKEWNSFEYNKDGELVPKKGVDEKELNKKFNQYKNRVSDIQGKYSLKDRRNFMSFEAGKNAIQFRLWAIDWMKERFGGHYIDANNVEHTGSWNLFTEQAIEDLKNDWHQHKLGIAWKNKQVMQNLKGAMAVALLLVLKYSGDEDKDKRKKALSLENALGNMFFIFDPEQLKYLLKNPIASANTVAKFVDAVESMITEDNKKAAKKVKKIIPYNKAIDLLPDEKK